MAEPTQSPSFPSRPSIPGSQLGEILVTLGAATQQQVNDALTVQNVLKELHKIDPTNPDFQPRLIGQIIEDMTKDAPHPVTEQQINDSLAIQKELRHEFNGDATPDLKAVQERIHEIAKQNDIPDLGREKQTLEIPHWGELQYAKQTLPISPEWGRHVETMLTHSSDNIVASDRAPDRAVDGIRSRFS